MARPESIPRIRPRFSFRWRFSGALEHTPIRAGTAALEIETTVFLSRRGGWSCGGRFVGPEIGSPQGFLSMKSAMLAAHTTLLFGMDECLEQHSIYPPPRPHPVWYVCGRWHVKIVQRFVCDPSQILCYHRCQSRHTLLLLLFVRRRYVCTRAGAWLYLPQGVLFAPLPISAPVQSYVEYGRRSSHRGPHTGHGLCANSSSGEALKIQVMSSTVQQFITFGFGLNQRYRYR